MNKYTTFILSTLLLFFVIPTKALCQGYYEKINSYIEVRPQDFKDQLKDVNNIKMVKDAEIEINNCFVYSNDSLKGRCPMYIEIKTINIPDDTLYTIKIVFLGKGKDNVNTPSYISKIPFFRYEKDDNIEYYFSSNDENYIILLDKKNDASLINCSKIHSEGN